MRLTFKGEALLTQCLRLAIVDKNFDAFGS